MSKNWASLIPELARWNDGKGIGIHAWLSAIGRYDHAVAYLALFWPEFVLHDGCVLLVPIDSRTYDEWLSRHHGDRRRVEASMNHRHLRDVFANSPVPPTKELLTFLGQTAAHMWLCKLATEFAGRRFEAPVNVREVAGGVDCEITCFQLR